MALAMAAKTSKTTFPHSLPLTQRKLTAVFLCVNPKVNHENFKVSNIKVPPNPYPVHGIRSTDITVDPSRKLWFRTYIPTQLPNTITDDHLSVIVFFHGGGFGFFNADSLEYDNICRRFAGNVPAVVVSVDYRLAPYHRFPAQYEDGIDVLKFLDENYKNVCKLWPPNADLSRCFLVGDSAGGNIAHNVAVRALQNQEFVQLKVIGVVAIQPFFGGKERTKAEIRLQGMSNIASIKNTDLACRGFLPPGEGMNRDHPAINVSGPNAIDISRLEFPPTLVLIGGNDPLQDWQMRYYDWLKNSGKEAYLVEYPNMCHSFYVNPELPESGKLILDVTSFIDKL